MEDNGIVCKYVKSSAEAIVAPAPSVATAAAPMAVAVAVASEATIHNGKGAQSKMDEPEELLGSVTTQNCPGTRASARVIQKMKLDLTRPMTPPPSERELSKKEEKATQKTPSQMRAANKTTWTNLERNYFFDALNEFGKDFEAVANCINGKLKRRNTSSDYSFKSKDQVRQHYYQTYHKIGKYVRYSDGKLVSVLSLQTLLTLSFSIHSVELKKPAQELYTLINYGEMRRKLQFLTEKHFMKLKQLIYHGHIIVRSKGKNIRIKTPSCKALRRLNQLDGESRVMFQPLHRTKQFFHSMQIRWKTLGCPAKSRCWLVRRTWRHSDVFSLWHRIHADVPLCHCTRSWLASSKHFSTNGAVPMLDLPRSS